MFRLKVTWLSHSCFEFNTQGKTILIDPFFSGNKLAPPYSGKPDVVLVTHSHFDHADAKRFDSTVICPSTCKFKKSVTMKIGDKKNVEGINVEMISASHHQDSYPTGYILELEGKRIAHLGDTYIDGVKKLPNIDLLLLPIGGYYTMNIDEAVKALEIVTPKLAIPMHFNTLGEIKADPNEFKAKAEKKGFKVRVLRIGETIEY
jgi:L-ascorbate metabolism protein UlaG (beta-lactamase superfamily)